MSQIILGVTGSIAAYQAADLANQLTKNEHTVHVIMTKAATEFITPLTFETLTKQPVSVDQFAVSGASEAAHTALAGKADLAVIAPATANFIAKAAAGVADDMLTTTLLALENVPILLCPAMSASMYRNPLTQRNKQLLENLGYFFVEPRETRLACGGLGKGALAETAVILEEIADLLNPELWGAYI